MMSHTAELPRARTIRGLSAKVASSLKTHTNQSVSEASCSAKRPRLASTRQISRGLSARALTSEDDDDDDDDIRTYSNRVSLMWNVALPIPNQECSISSADKVSITNDNEAVVIVTSGEQADRSISTAKSPLTDESPLPKTVVPLEDPTPPPTPCLTTRRYGGRRITKSVKVAMQKLQDAQNMLRDCDNEDKDDIIIVDDTSRVAAQLSIITIKVRSRSGIHRYHMKPRDSFADVMTKMSRIENVSEEDIIMFVNDRTIHAYDSPQTLQLTVADIVECHIRGSDVSNPTQSDEMMDDRMIIDLLFQTTDSKTAKIKLRMRKDEPMEKVMREYCRLNGVRYDSVSFQFDGDRIDSASTPESLDLESDYCIDVVPK